MSSVKARIKTNRLKKDGQAPIVIQIIHNQKSTELGIGRSVLPEDWDGKRGIVKAKLPNRDALNAYIRREVREIEAIIDQLLAAGGEFSVQNIVSQKKGNGRLNQSVIEFLEGYIEENPDALGFNTLRTYKSTLTALKLYKADLRFKDINVGFLENFVRYLKRELKNKTNTVHGRLKVVRKLCRMALKMGLMESYPFRDFRLRTESSRREYLNPKELKQFEAVDVKSDSEWLVKHCFLFSCYTGLRFSDICTLRKDNIHQEKGVSRMNFTISKTEEQLAFELPIPATRILESWGNEYPNIRLLVPILDENTKQLDMKRAISSRNVVFNTTLKTLANRSKITKNLTFHMARHTFATLSLSMGISMEILSKLLGHTDLKTTQIYGKIMDKAKDEAMKKWNKL